MHKQIGTAVKVANHRLLGSIRIPLSQSLENVLVLNDGDILLSRPMQHFNMKRLQPAQHILCDAIKQGISGNTRNLNVKAHVALNELRDVAQRGPLIRNLGGKAVDIAFCRSLRRYPYQSTLEEFAGLNEMLKRRFGRGQQNTRREINLPKNRRFIWMSNPRSLAVYDCDQSMMFQPLEGLAYRGPPDAENSHQFPLRGNKAVIRKRSVKNLRFETIKDFVGQLSSLYRLLHSLRFI
nr:hypothetical protein [Gluconobacter oxydans]